MKCLFPCKSLSQSFTTPVTSAMPCGIRRNLGESDETTLYQLNRSDADFATRCTCLAGLIYANIFADKPASELCLSRRNEGAVGCRSSPSSECSFHLQSRLPDEVDSIVLQDSPLSLDNDAGQYALVRTYRSALRTSGPISLGC